MIKFREKHFMETIPFDKLNHDQIRSIRQKYQNLEGLQNKLTRFQVYPETKVACQYSKAFSKLEIQKFLSNMTKVLT